MYNFLLLCGILFQIEGCGREVKDYEREETLGGDPHLVAEYYNHMADYIDEGVGPGDDKKVIGVQYGPLTTTILGLCTFDPRGRVITLRYDLMFNLAQRNLILVHEMGHCVYNQGHYDEDIDIMNTFSDDEQEKINHWPKYFHKLCQRILETRE